MSHPYFNREEDDGHSSQQKSPLGGLSGSEGSHPKESPAEGGHPLQQSPVKDTGSPTSPGSQPGSEGRSKGDLDPDRTCTLDSPGKEQLQPGAKRSTSQTSSRQLIQKIVYYQNRFITVFIDPASGKIVDTGPPQSPGSSTQGAARTKTGPQTDTGISLDPDGADEQDGGSEKGGCQLPSCLKTCCMYLQDNRLKTGSEETKRKLRDQNQLQDQTNMILKKVLNIIFVTTGVSLFLAVIIVIIYTSIGKLYDFTTVKQEIFACRKISQFSRNSVDLRKFPVEKMYCFTLAEKVL